MYHLKANTPVKYPAKSPMKAKQTPLKKVAIKTSKATTAINMDVFSKVKTTKTTLPEPAWMEARKKRKQDPVTKSNRIRS